MRPPVGPLRLRSSGVAKPWRTGSPQLGINVYWTENLADDDEVTRAKARRLMDYIVALKANSVAINFPFFVDGYQASAVHGKEGATPTPQRLGMLLEEAAKREVRVAVRPLLEEQNLMKEGRWRGRIEPADRAAWFDSYEKFLRPYLVLAQQHGAAEFIAGVELNSMQTDKRWRALLTAARRHFSGELSYSANHDAFQRKVATPSTDTVGVDAYFSVDLPDNASVDSLTAAWTRWLKRNAGKDLPRLVIHEAGIAAQRGAYRKPAQWGSPKVPIDLAIQKNWYTAVCRAVSDNKMAGIYFWSIRFHANPGHEDPQQPDRLSFVDRPAQDAIRDCYGRLGR